MVPTGGCANKSGLYFGRDLNLSIGCPSQIASMPVSPGFQLSRAPFAVMTDFVNTQSPMNATGSRERKHF